MDKETKNHASPKKPRGITKRAFILGTFFSVLFAVITIYLSNALSMYVTATQIPVLPYVLLIVMVLLLNPLCRLIRVVRAFAASELMIIFIMGMVSAGLSTFGLVEQVLPIVGGLFNPEWNTRQSEWNRYVVPWVNNDYFLTDNPSEIREAAKAYHDAFVVAHDKSLVLDSARRYEAARAQVLEAEAALKKLMNSGAPGTQNKLALAEVAAENANRILNEAREQWDALNEGRDLPAIEEVLATYSGLLDSARERVESVETHLRDLQSESFEMVATFRRGLPEGMQAYPGFFPMPEDNTSSYFRRMRRLVHGKAAVSILRNGIETAGAEWSPQSRAEAAELLEQAAARLRPLGDKSELESERDMIRERMSLLMERRIALNLDRRQKSEERRAASRSEAHSIDREIRRLDSELHDNDKHEKRLIRAQDRNENELVCAGKVNELAAEIEKTKEDVMAGRLTAGEFTDRVNGLLPAFVSIDASLRRYFVGEVPWRQWARPLANWALVIGITYAVLMALNLLIFRQWAYNEKLSYPLAELPKVLVGGPEAGDTVPPVFRNGLFWAGFCMSAMVMGWNLFCSLEIVPGLNPFDLSNRWYPYVFNTPFNALRHVRSVIFFTMIGLAFLIPKNISFSLWFFQIVAMIILLGLVWAGYGQDLRSFPRDWLSLLNFQTGLGQGAIMVFSGAVLYKCRKYILCAFAPATVKDLDRSERSELKISSLVFVFGSLALIILLWRSMGANIYHTIFFYLVMILVIIGLVRAVTEGGLLSFQTWASPFHFMRAFFGLDRSWTCTSLFAPLLVYSSILFMDIKAIIAPAMANAIKLRDDFNIKRSSFHGAVFWALLVSAVAATIAGLLMAYSGGADSMSRWFYHFFPTRIFNTVRSMTEDAPAASASISWWVVVGGGAMLALLIGRQFWFWLPHPLGLVVIGNPRMSAFWFPILLGWLCNTAITKYGNRETYKRSTGFFIGLIIGELFIVTVSMIVAIITEQRVGIDLNLS